MKRTELESFIMETYNAEADYPWLKTQNTQKEILTTSRLWSKAEQ